MLNNEVNLRFQRLLTTLNKEVSDVVSDAGGTPAKYYRLFRGEVKPNYDTLFEIINAYPEINGDWLLTGRGAMFVDDKESDRVRELEGKVQALEDVLLRAMGKKSKGVTVKSPRLIPLRGGRMVAMFGRLRYVIHSN